MNQRPNTFSEAGAPGWRKFKSCVSLSGTSIDVSAPKSNAVTPEGLMLRETAPGVSSAAVHAATGAPLLGG